MAGPSGNAAAHAGGFPVSRWPYQYVGTPFLDGGRDAFGCDCWGLVRRIYADQLSIDLPSYGEISASELYEIAKAMDAGRALDGPWVEVQKPKEFDVCLMLWEGKRLIGHIGVCVDGKSIIHTEAGINAAIVPVIHSSIKRRIAGFWRHRSQL